MVGFGAVVTVVGFGFVVVFFVGCCDAQETKIDNPMIYNILRIS